MTLLEVLLDSKEIKRIIVERSFEYNIPLRYLCREAKVNYNVFLRQYINSTEDSGCEVTEAQFKKILNILGITIRYQFIIDKGVDMVARSKELTDKYEVFQEKRKELQRKPNIVLNRRNRLENK